MCSSDLRRAVGPLSTGRSRPPVDASVDPNPGLVMAFPPPPVPPADGDGSATARCSRARRAAAGLLDRIVIVGPTAATYLLWQLTARPRAGGGGPDEATVVGLYVLSLLWALVSGFTDLVVVQGITGQSLGKRLLHIRLVRDRDGEPLGVGPALVRWTLSIGFGLLTCGIGAVLDHLWPLWSGDGKRIVDTWRACSVVDAPDGPAPAPPAPPAAPTLP